MSEGLSPSLFPVLSNPKIEYNAGIIRSFLVRQPTPKNLGNIREIAWRFRRSRPNFPDNSCQFRFPLRSPENLRPQSLSTPVHNKLVPLQYSLNISLFIERGFPRLSRRLLQLKKEGAFQKVRILSTKQKDLYIMWTIVIMWHTLIRLSLGKRHFIIWERL